MDAAPRLANSFSDEIRRSLEIAKADRLAGHGLEQVLEKAIKEALIHAFPDEQVAESSWQEIATALRELVHTEPPHHGGLEQMRQAMEAAQAGSRAKSEFLATLSHEIRTPMNGVIGMTSLLKETPLTTLQSDYLETIRASGDALLALLNDILDYSKIEAGQLELERIPFDPRLVVEEVAELFAEKTAAKGVGLHLNFDPSATPRIEGDPGRLRQVLLNLVGNSAKFTSFGQIWIRAYSDSLHSLTFEVQDTGPGIPAKAQAQIFEPFRQADASTTRRYGGTGLGLAICKQLVDLMGGAISVVSSSKTGSIFRFSIRTSPAVGMGESWSHGLPGRKILLAVPDPEERRNLTQQLKHWGALPTPASDLESCRKLASESGWDAVIVSAWFPAGQGWDLFDCFSGIPFCLLSSPDPFQSALEPAQMDRLQRPIRPSRLSRWLRSALRITGSIPHLPANPPKDVALWAEGTGPRVLVVEDNIVNQMVALQMLQVLGCRTEVANDGLEAVNFCQAGKYDLILMDVQMPRMDGFAASRAIRTHGVKTPILAMTANALKGDRQACLGAGMNDYVTKPVRLEDLREALHRWLVVNAPLC